MKKISVHLTNKDKGGCESIKTGTIAIIKWYNSNFQKKIQRTGLYSVSAGCDSIHDLPTSACFRRMMWAKYIRAQWVLIAEGALDITDFAVKLFFWNYILYNWKCAKFDRLALLVLYLKVLYFTVEVVYISEKKDLEERLWRAAIGSWWTGWMRIWNWCCGSPGDITDSHGNVLSYQSVFWHMQPPFCHKKRIRVFTTIIAR